MEYSEDIKTLRIVDLVNKYPITVRLRNCINKAQELNELPFETVENYLDAMSTAKTKLLEIDNLGSKTADELIRLIESAIHRSLPPDSSNIPSEQYLSEVEHPEQIREVRIIDLVNKYATSVRLRNLANKLPFETIGDYLDAGSTAKRKLLDIENLGKKTATELVHLIDTVTKGIYPKNLSTKDGKIY